MPSLHSARSPHCASLSRRRWLQLGAWAALAGAGLAQAAAEGRVQLARVASLPDALSEAVAARRPLVVLVSLDGCPWCRMVRDSFLGPLRDERGQPVLQVDVHHNRMARDFAGRPVTHDELARAWGISITPTVLFFGPGGRELAPRLVGGYLPDFYGAYLDERMETALRAMR